MNETSMTRGRRIWVALLIVVAALSFLAGAVAYRQRVTTRFAPPQTDTTGAVPDVRRVLTFTATTLPARYVNVGPVRDGRVLIGTCSSSPPAIKRCFVYLGTEGTQWQLARDFSDGVHVEVPLVFPCDRGFYATLHPNPVELWRSTDRGISWSKVFSHPTERSIYCMAETSEWLIIATWPEGKIYRSRDGATGWECVYKGVQDGFFSLLTFPGAGDGGEPALFAGSSNILKSTDGGRTWRRVIAGTVGPIRALFADTTGSVHALADNGSLQSHDGGETWETRHYTLARGHLCHFSVMHRGCMYTGGEEGTVFKSCDGGKTWERFFDIPQTKTPSAPVHVRGVTAFGDDIYIGTSCYQFSGEPRGTLYRVPASAQH